MVNVDVRVGEAEDSASARPLPDSPFCIAVIGDFGGDAARSPLRDRQAIPFDRDDLDAAVARVQPTVNWSPDGAPAESLRFTSMEHFHPDSLYERVGVFGALRDLRRRLLDPRSAAATAQELRPASGVEAGPKAREPARPASASSLTSGASLLDSVLEATPGAAPASDSAPKREDELSAFLRRIVAPHLVSEADPRQAQLLAAAEAAVSEQMRALLHDAAFQALESSWRAADFLARRIETSTSLRLYLIDVARLELDAALDTAANARDTAVYGLLRGAAKAIPSGAHWSVLAGLYTFGNDPADAARLTKLGNIARTLGAPWISAAAAELIGLASYADLMDHNDLAPLSSPEWDALRGSADARWLGLAAPRFLLRNVYGEDGETVDAFAFEEGDAGHDAYLWGNPAAACALLLAKSFEHDGWRLRPSRHSEIRGLPLHLYRRGAETFALPCAENLLTEEIAELMLEAGIMPLASIRETDAVRMLRIQSLASPLAPLAGPWAASG